MLTTAAIVIIENTIDKIITSDPVTTLALQKLEGKVLEISITDVSISFFLLPHRAGFDIHQRVESPADTKLHGKLDSFRALLTSSDKTQQFFGNGIQISGDTQLAAKVQKIFINSQIDWQGLTAQVTGDLIAHQLAEFSKATVKQLGITKRSLELNIAEYLQEEAYYLPARAEVEGFITDIDAIRDSTERLEARINLLVAR